jgi:methyl-accepting chemotaxis protein
VTEKVGYSLLILVPKDDNEFGKWQNLTSYNDKNNIKYWSNNQQTIYFVRPANSGIESTEKIHDDNFTKVLNVLLSNDSDSFVILAKHFGNNAPPQEDLINSIRKINPNIVVLHYSLHIEGTDGHPPGIKKLYDKLSGQVENAGEIFEELFQLFSLEAIKKKYEDRINQIADFQLLLSSYLLLDGIENKSKEVDNKIQEIQEQIKAQAEKFVEQGIISSIKNISFTAELCKDLNQRLDDEKNKLIDKYAELRKNAA